MKKSPIQYTQEANHIPDFMKDFHDCKDLFKSINQQYSKGDKPSPVNWVDAHVYTVDYFLWFMGQHGYKLQKIKSKDVDFYDLHETLKALKEDRMKSDVQIFKNITSQEGKTNTAK